MSEKFGFFRFRGRTGRLWKTALPAIAAVVKFLSGCFLRVWWKFQFQMAVYLAPHPFFIHPPDQLKAIAALLTNFHLQKPTLIMLVSAIAVKTRVCSQFDKEKPRYVSPECNAQIHPVAAVKPSADRSAPHITLTEFVSKES